jgi:hypothetical protein
MSNFSADALYAEVRHSFSTVKEGLGRKPTHSLPDVLMCGLAIFGQKCASLLDFDKKFRSDDPAAINFKALMGVSNVPSDTQMRQRLDGVNPDQLYGAFNCLHSHAKRHGVYDDYLMNGVALVALDGTGFFSSSRVSCSHCLVKNSRSGETTYQHQAVGAVMVHPQKSQVLAFAPEFICNADGATKNDSERNASKRLLQRLREENPDLKMIVVEDGLSSNGPHISLLKELGMGFILGAKPGDHVFLFEQVELARTRGSLDTFRKQIDSVWYEVEILKGVQLNRSTSVCVDFMWIKTTNKKGKSSTFSWVTDQLLDQQSWFKVMKCGRSRWKIENETFNTLKNQGYHFEHNFGHGYEFLCNILAALAFLQFLIDQLISLRWELFDKALKRQRTSKNLWQSVNVFFFSVPFATWEELFEVIAGVHALVRAKSISGP